MGSHALISTYKNTESSDQPLILVVGREPNSDAPFNRSTGAYDFDHAPRCAFWNESYAVVGKLCGMSGQEFKHLCRKTTVSPIAFTDISPVPIQNLDPQKKKKRKAITTDQIDEHIQNIMHLSSIIDRTAVVILTGHRFGALSKQARVNFDYGATQLEHALNFRKFPSISVPFMFGNNQGKILESIKRDNNIYSRILSIHDSLLEFKKAV